MWNDEKARLVVIDGQHRAMALLAIDRTARDNWGEGKGARYRAFYEARVRAALREEDASLDSLQVPVTLCWFPDVEDGANKAARKLFVDVNKNARPPSRDRLVLLSDDDLAHSFTRTLLDQLADQPDTWFPLASVEYDNPGDQSRHGRWTALTELQGLLRMVEHTVFGPAKYVRDVSLALRGREPVDTGVFMREQLALGELLPATIDLPDGEAVQRNDITRDNFPSIIHSVLQRRFLSTWGQALLHLLARVPPYSAHHQAVVELEATWQPAAVEADLLAREALLEGVGMYWTLRAHSMRVGIDPNSQAAQAWSLVQSRRTAFLRRRAELYLGPDAATSAAEVADECFDIVSTQAAQIGLALLLASLCYAAGSKPTDTPRMAEALADGLIAAMSPGASVDRRLVFSPRAENAVYLLSALKPARAMELRYLWLELICTPEGSAPLLSATNLSIEALQKLRDGARWRYVEFIADERAAAAYRQERNTPKAKHREAQLANIHLTLQSGLEHWFGVSRESYQLWSATSSALAAEDDDDED